MIGFFLGLCLVLAVFSTLFWWVGNEMHRALSHGPVEPGWWSKLVKYIKTLFGLLMVGVWMIFKKPGTPE